MFQHIRFPSGRFVLYVFLHKLLYDLHCTGQQCCIFDSAFLLVIFFRFAECLKGVESGEIAETGGEAEGSFSEHKVSVGTIRMVKGGGGGERVNGVRSVRTIRMVKGERGEETRGII